MEPSPNDPSLARLGTKKTVEFPVVLLGFFSTNISRLLPRGHEPNLAPLASRPSRAASFALASMMDSIPGIPKQ